MEPDTETETETEAVQRTRAERRPATGASDPGEPSPRESRGDWAMVGLSVLMVDIELVEGAGGAGGDSPAPA